MTEAVFFTNNDLLLNIQNGPLAIHYLLSHSIYSSKYLDLTVVFYLFFMLSFRKYLSCMYIILKELMEDPVQQQWIHFFFSDYLPGCKAQNVPGPVTVLVYWHYTHTQDQRMSSHCGAGQPLVSSSSHIIGRKRDHWSFSASDTGRRWCQWGLHLPSWAIAGLTSTLVPFHHSLLYLAFQNLKVCEVIHTYQDIQCIYKSIYIYKWCHPLLFEHLWTMSIIVNLDFNHTQVLLSSVPKTTSELDVNSIPVMWKWNSCNCLKN